MSLDNLFKFVSTEEHEKNMRNYQKSIFPFGPEQKEAALNALRPLINKKISDSELLFVFIVSKQKYTESEVNPDDAAWQYLKKNKYLTDMEKSYVFSLVKLDIEAKSLEKYPLTDDIKLYAETKL